MASRPFDGKKFDDTSNSCRVVRDMERLGTDCKPSIDSQKNGLLHKMHHQHWYNTVPVCKYAELMGGTVTCHSELELGTTFTVHFKVKGRI